MSYKRILAVLLCLALLLCGCSQPPQQTAEDLVAAYEAAKTPVLQATDFSIAVTYKLDRTVNGQVFSQSYTATVSYLGYGTDSMTASVSQQLKYGAYENDYAEYYAGGTAYCGVNDCLFSSAMTAQEFTGRQLPAVLADAKLYTNVTSHMLGNDTVIVFSGATAPESWAVTGQNTQLISGSATATLGANGALKETAYVAELMMDGFLCHLEATVAIVTPSTPVIPEQESTPIEYFDAPKLLMQAAGAILSADAISAADQETLHCDAAALTQTSQQTIDFLGSGADFMAKSDYTVTVTNYTGVPTTSTMTETFRDGTYSYALNGGTPIVQADVTAQKMRTDCEDLLLGWLFTPEYIQNAQLTDTGDFLYIHLTGNDTFVSDTCNWIYSGIGANLDEYASSVSTEEAFGWVSLNKYTWLPTAIGQSMTRAHVIERVSYPLTYEYSLSLHFSKEDAYLNITGSLPAETAPETAVTPLLYKVTGEDGKQMWLLGTIHVGDAATAFFPKALTDALAGSDALAVETYYEAFTALLETDSALRQQLALGYYYTDGSGTADHLEKELHDRAVTMLRCSGDYGYATGLMKPALWENTIGNFLLQQTYSLSPEKGVEQRLFTLAAQADLPILDIEDPLTHALLITSYSPALQSYLLATALDTTLSQYAGDTRALYDLWCQGDETALTEALQEDTSQYTEEELGLYNEYYTALITNRNALMLEKATEYLESDQTVFFAVGLAHVLGEGGLVETLQAAGYTVQAVSYAE